MRESSDHRSLFSHLAASRAALATPSVATFARLAGTARPSVRFVDAARYVGLVAFIAGLIAMPRGNEAVLGTFLSGLLGFATLAWFVHRLTLAGSGTGAAAGLGEIGYVIALFWAPIVVASSLLITVATWLGLGAMVAPIVGIASVVAGLALALLALRAILRRGPIATAVVVFLSAGASYGVDRFVWTLVGAG